MCKLQTFLGPIGLLDDLRFPMVVFSGSRSGSKNAKKMPPILLMLGLGLSQETNAPGVLVRYLISSLISVARARVFVHGQESAIDDRCAHSACIKRGRHTEESRPRLPATSGL